MAPTDRQRELGARLRDIRLQKGMTLQEVEQASGGTWKSVVVSSYERGDRAITVSRLAGLAAFYGVPVREFLPGSEARPSPAARGPKVRLDLTQLELGGADDADVPLSRYVRTIQVQRGDYNGRVMTLRRADLQALSAILGLATEDLVSALGRRGLLHGVPAAQETSTPGRPTVTRRRSRPG